MREQANALFFATYAQDEPLHSHPVALVPCEAEGSVLYFDDGLYIEPGVYTMRLEERDDLPTISMTVLETRTIFQINLFDYAGTITEPRGPVDKAALLKRIAALKSVGQMIEPMKGYFDDET